MDLPARLAALFRLDDEGWARHANPWSVWTRFAVLPVLTLALWSRVWLGWGAWAPAGAVLLFTWLNPRLFSAVPPNGGWVWRAVMGERLWTRRRRRPLPDHHLWWAALLSALQAPPTVLWIWGVWALSPWATLSGMVGIYLTKLWFLDRMAWLHDEVEGPSAPRNAP